MYSSPRWLSVRVFRISLASLFFCVLLFAGSEYTLIHPDRVVDVDESNYILPMHGNICFNPYNQQIYISVPNGFVTYTLEGKMTAPHKTHSYQEPGGFRHPHEFFFFPDFFYGTDRLKSVKLTYDNVFVSELKGAFGFDTVIEDGGFLYYNKNDGLCLYSPDGERKVQNRKLIFVPRLRTSMVNYYSGFNFCVDGQIIWASAMHCYELLKLDRNSLRIMDRFGDKPKIFKEPDDTKPGVYGMQFIGQLEEVCRGNCWIRFAKPFRNYLIVYWLVESETEGYVDIYDKTTLECVNRFKLEPFHYQNNRAVDFDPKTGRLFQEDNLDVDGKEQTVLRVYDLTKYLDKSGE